MGRVFIFFTSKHFSELMALQSLPCAGFFIYGYCLYYYFFRSDM